MMSSLIAIVLLGLLAWATGLFHIFVFVLFGLMIVAGFTSWMD